MSCPSFELSLVKAMSEEACSAYLCQMFVIKLFTMSALLLNQMYGIHVFVILILDA